MFASAGPGVCWKCGAKLEAEPTILHLRFRQRQLAIHNESNIDVTAGYVAVLGGREAWIVSSIATPTATVVGLQLNFGHPTNVVGDYVVNDQSAAITPFNPLPNRARFYWAQDGLIPIIVSATINGQMVQERFTVQVLSPVLSRFTAETSMTRITSTLADPRGTDAENRTTSALAFGSPPDDGIAFTIQVNLPGPHPMAGHLTMTQIMRVYRQRVSNGAQNTIQSLGFVVDREFHYGYDDGASSSASASGGSGLSQSSSSHSSSLSQSYSSSSSSSHSRSGGMGMGIGTGIGSDSGDGSDSDGDNSGNSLSRSNSFSSLGGGAMDDEGDPPNEPLAVVTGQYNLMTQDSPSTLLGFNGRYRDTDRVIVNEEYRMYVMYRPTNGIWVALGEIVWFWHARGVYNITTNRFDVHFGAQGTENRSVHPSLAFARLPLWNGNSSDHLEEWN
ncbi:hypothetical protein [Pseudomonas sp. GM18]|uniref:hypothetical protein n=1 Tax=Pseudomonas sp. GM18 TaxID=1144324 RepID=UPI0012FABC3D|nr:hypothetical protein [Pseudomonas sp. GM18]